MASGVADIIGSGQAGEEKIGDEKKDEAREEQDLDSQKIAQADEVVETTTTLASA